jgi:hypothetical protein
MSPGEILPIWSGPDLSGLEEPSPIQYALKTEIPERVYNVHPPAFQPRYLNTCVRQPVYIS